MIIATTMSNNFKMKLRHLEDNLPLSNNLQGQYKFNEPRKEFICLKKRQSAKEKKIYNIRLGDNSNNIWVNHRDYSNFQTTYTTSTNFIEFEYNDTTYLIEKPCVSDEVISIKKKKVSTVK